MDIEEKVNNFVLFEVFNLKISNKIKYFCLNCPGRKNKKKRSVVVVAVMIHFFNNVVAEVVVIIYVAFAFVFFAFDLKPSFAAFGYAESDFFIRTYFIVQMFVVQSLTFGFFLAAA